MKKTLHLFLCLILVISTFSNLIIAEAALPASAKLVEISYDTSQMTYSEPSRDSSTVFRPKFIDGNGKQHIIYAFKTTRLSYAVPDISMAGSVKMGWENTNDSNITLYPINTASALTVTEGKYTYTGKMYADKDTNSDGYADFSQSTLQINRGKDFSKTITIPANKILANVWYDYEICVDLNSSPSSFSVKYKEVGSDGYAFNASATFAEKFYNGIRMDLEYSAGTTGYYMWYKDFKLVSDSNVYKTEILSVNSDALAIPNQKNVSFKLSAPITGLAEKPQLVSAIDGNGAENKAQSITISSDGLTVNAVLTNNLFPWSDYTLKIDKTVYDGFVHEETGESVTDTGLSKPFSVASTGFDMREKSVVSSAGRLDYELEITNADSSCQSIMLMLPVYNSNGVMEGLAYAEPVELPVNGQTKPVLIGADYSLSYASKLFAVTSWSDMVPLFNKYWYLGPTLSDLAAASSAEGLFAGDFDYSKNKIKIDANTGSETTKTGVLVVYNKAQALGSSNLPVYIDYLTTASDGTFSKDVLFKENIQSTTASYKIEFYFDGSASPLESEFICYCASDRLNMQRLEIFNAAKSSSTVGLLKQAILGVNENDEVVNNNYSVFGADADTTKYNSLKNKAAVFTKMISSVSGLSDYDALVSLFERAAQDLYNEENTPKRNPSSDNKNYGSPSGTITATPPASASPSDNSVSSETVSFTDMQGHWAEIYASKLNKTGIMNGYPDGSFKGENPITRAELTKTLAVAFNIPSGSELSFSDVDKSSWYAPYVAGALSAGVVNGFEDGTFAPDSNITRQDAVLMIYRAMKRQKDIKVGYVFFMDDFSIRDYAYDAVTTLASLKIVEGDENSNFNPYNQITRAELAAVVSRAIDYMESH